MSVPVNYKQWMGDLPGYLTKIPLTCLGIPGSHNSGTYNLDSSLGVAVDQPRPVKRLDSLCCSGSPVSSFVHRWSKTQHLSFTQQLELGIRYFDCRICTQPGTLEIRFVHGLYGVEVFEALLQIKQFLQRNPKEVVILDFNHFYNMTPDSHQAVLDQIKGIFKNLLIPEGFGQMREASLESLWRTPHRVMVIYHDDTSVAQSSEVWSGFNITSLWANTNNATTLIYFLEQNYQAKNLYYAHKFYSWQGVLTPTGKDIIRHLPHTLDRTLSAEGSRSFCNWLKDKKAGPQGINICCVDFVEKFNFVQTVLDLNYKIPATSLYL